MLVGLVSAAMLGAAALAAIPTPSRSYFEALQGQPEPDAGDGRMMIAAQYGPVPALLDPVPLGEGQVATPGVTDAPAPRRNQSNFRIYASRPDPVPGQVETPVVIAAAGLGAEDLDCKLDQFGRRAAVPLDRLISMIKTGLNGLRADTPGDVVRALVQADLNRSGDGPKVKTDAVEILRASYAQTPSIATALSKPFDLYDNAPANVPGYDPCGNPAAIGGSAFGVGAFASDFATINPVPVVASRLSAATEGGI